MSTAPKPELNLDLILAHHDAKISSLDDRMSGVEKSLHSVSESLSRGFAAINDRLGSFENSRGPGIQSIMGLVAIGGSIVGMSAAAITFLVTSYVSPPITRLEGQVASLRYYVDRREELDRSDLIDLRRNRDKSVNEDIAQLGKMIRQIETRAASSLRGPITN